MRFPPRVMLAVVVAVVLAALAAWAVVRLPYVRGLAPTASQRRLLALVVAVFFALLSAWVVFVLPAYWD
jgi:branched-subunit amino acid transport protein